MLKVTDGLRPTGTVTGRLHLSGETDTTTRLGTTAEICSFCPTGSARRTSTSTGCARSMRSGGVSGNGVTNRATTGAIVGTTTGGSFGDVSLTRNNEADSGICRSPRRQAIESRHETTTLAAILSAFSIIGCEYRLWRREGNTILCASGAGGEPSTSFFAERRSRTDMRCPLHHGATPFFKLV